jgi:hypothetical protein
VHSKENDVSDLTHRVAPMERQITRLAVTASLMTRASGCGWDRVHGRLDRHPAGAIDYAGDGLTQRV